MYDVFIAVKYVSEFFLVSASIADPDRIHRIHMFLDMDMDMDPDPDPSIIMQK